MSDNSHTPPMNIGPVSFERVVGARSQDPRSVPWAPAGERDVVAVDTTWGSLQAIQCAPGVQTVGERELADMVARGSRGGITLPGESAAA